MNYAVRLLTISMVAAFAVGCTTHFQTHISSVTREKIDEDDAASTGLSTDGNTILYAAGDYIVVRFTTSIDIVKAAHDVDAALIGYSLYPCTQKETYVEIGYVHASSVAPTGLSYEIRVPGAWAQLGWRKPNGELAMGWPLEATDATNICLQISGANMLGMGVDSGDIRVDAVRDLLRRSQ